MTDRFPALFRELALGSLTIRNRIVMGPHQAQLGSDDGLPNLRLRDYLLRRARGGVGLMIAEGGVILPNSVREPPVLRAYRPEYAERWRPIVDAIHAEGVPIVGQLIHSGRQASNYTNPDMPLWAPSAIACPVFRQIPKEMEHSDIEACLEAYASAAKSLVDAGFDGVEIQACHGYLINQFLSPYSNKRADEYGGPLENRMRFLLAVVARVRRAIGPTVLLGVRLESTEYVAGGLDVDDTLVVAKAVEDSKQVQYLNVSQGVRETSEFIRAPTFLPPAYAADVTARFKAALGLPVFAVGRMRDPEIADRCVREGKADAIVLTRELFADPDYPRKAREGRGSEIRPCIACLECVFHVANGRPLRCIYNPEIGREGAPVIAIRKRSHVVVVGGGPAGLESARVLAERGHRVTLFEREATIGGAIRFAAETPGREDFRLMIDYYGRELVRLGVATRLGAVATVDGIVAAEPDAVIVATGAKPVLPPSPLLPNVHVEPGARVLSYLDAMTHKWRPGDRVVLVDGEYDALAMSLAERLVAQGVLVHFVTPAEKPGLRLDVSTSRVWFQRLCSRGTTLVPFHALAVAGDGQATLRQVSGGPPTTIACDAIVYAHTRVADDGLYRQLASTALHTLRVGDCVAPRAALFAVHEAFMAASTI